MFESLASMSELILAAAFFLLALNSSMFCPSEMPSKVSRSLISCSPTILLSFFFNVNSWWELANLKKEQACKIQPIIKKVQRHKPCHLLAKALALLFHSGQPGTMLCFKSLNDKI